MKKQPANIETLAQNYLSTINRERELDNKPVTYEENPELWGYYHKMGQIVCQERIAIKNLILNMEAKTTHEALIHLILASGEIEDIYLNFTDPEAFKKPEDYAELERVAKRAYRGIRSALRRMEKAFPHYRKQLHALKEFEASDKTYPFVFEKIPSPSDFIRLAEKYTKEEKTLNDLVREEPPHENDQERAKWQKRVEAQQDKMLKMETEITAFPVTTHKEAVLKARMVELSEGSGYINSGKCPASVSTLARDLERLAGVPTPEPEQKIHNILYGF